MRTAYAFGDLPSFLAAYYEGMSVLLTEQDFYDLATAYFRKAHSQHVVYAEVFSLRRQPSSSSSGSCSAASARNETGSRQGCAASLRPRRSL
jgi:adenosine deaminase